MVDEGLFAIAGVIVLRSPLRRALRPATKLALKGVIAAVDATADARTAVREIYEEAKSERSGNVETIAVRADDPVETATPRARTRRTRAKPKSEI